MKTKLVTSTLLVFVSALLLRAAPVDDRLAEGRAALAAHDLATARAKFQQARIADPANQTAAALLGITRWFALVGDAPANAVFTSLGMSTSGRNLYDWSATVPEDADEQVVLPNGYNFESTRSFWRDTVLSTSAAVRSDLAAVTNEEFVLTLTPAEVDAANSLTLDRADLLVVQAGLRAFEMMVNAGLGQNFSADYQRLLKLAQGDVLGFRQMMEENPDLFKAGPLESRLAAKAALLDFVTLYRRASAAVRARAPGLDRLFMLETEQDLSDEAEFRQHLVELEKAATDYVAFEDGRIHLSLAPAFTTGWSLRGSLPPMINGRFDPVAIGDASLGGMLLGTSREFFAHLLVELGYTADLGWTRLSPNPVSGGLQKYAYSGSFHIVTGANGTIGRSGDGVNWSFTQLVNAQDFFSIASNGAGVVIAVGNTQVWRSADHGATWKLVHTTWRESAPDNEGGQFGLVFDGSRFVSITANGYVWSSPDLGLTWKRGQRVAPSSVTLSIFGLDYANGVFVATGSTVVGGQTRSAIFTSTSATSWTLAFTGATTGFYRTATFGAGKWIAAGNLARVAYSKDLGVTWAEVPIGGSTDFFAGSTFANNSFVIAGARTGTSTDGVNWTFVSHPENGIAFADAVATDAFTYLPGPQGALYRRATDGTYTRVDSNNSQIARNVQLNDAVVFNNKLYVASSGGIVYESSDGSTFTARPTPTTNSLTTLAVHQGVLYAAGTLGTIVASSDGTNWQTRLSNDPAFTTNTINRLASLNGLLVASASNAVVLTSPNGSTWTRRSLSGGGSVASLAYGGGYHVAGLFNQNNPTNNYTEGAIYFSTDAVNWTRLVVDVQPGLNTTGVRAVVFDQGRFHYFLTSGRVLRTFSANPDQGWEDVAGDLGALVGAARVGPALVAHVQRTNDESRASFVYAFNPDNWDDWVRTELPSSEFPAGSPTQFNNRLYVVGGGGIYRANKPLTRPAPAATTPVTLVGQIGRNISIGAPFATSEELSYQWFYNGNAIAGANSATLDLVNLTNGQAGTYTVTATGGVTSGTATNTVTLLVVNGPPSITQQPSGGIAAAGSSFTLGVAASGSGPISYQWFKNNAAIDGATSAALVLNSLTANDAGSYRVEVTNTYGTVVSADAELAVSSVGAAPAFWDDTEASMYSPSRVFSDGSSHLFMTWNVVSRAQDVVDGIRTGSLFRLDEATGSIDPTFVWDERLGSPLFVVFQSDGRLLVAVNHAYGEGATIVRVNADGSRDNTYTAPRFDRSIRFMGSQPADGKLLVCATDNIRGNALLPAGSITTTNPTVFRLNTNGSLDNSFAPVVLDNVLFTPPVVDSQGRIYLGGQFRNVNGSLARRGIVRVDSAGVVDTAFANPADIPGWNTSTFNSIARSFVIQSDGKVVVVGRFAYTAKGTSSNPVIAIRFNVDGTFDGTFAQPLKSDTPSGPSVVYARYALLEANDKFLVTTDRLMRFNANGSLDNTWAATNTGYNKEIFWICRSATSGNLYLPDLDNNTPGNVVALTSAGAPLSGFDTGGFGSTIVPETAIILADGRVLAAGAFDHFGNLRQPGTALFGADGLLASDSTAFHNPGVLLQNPYAYVFQWPDRSFGVVRIDLGEQQTGNGSNSPTFVRYNADGSARGNWHFPDDPTAYNYAAMPDGGMIAWRPTTDFTQYAYSGTSNWVRRYNADGSYDPSFALDLSELVSFTRDSSNFPLFESATIADLQIAGDGSIFVLLGGRDAKMAVYKLRPNGMIDSSYTPTTVADAPSSVGFSNPYFDPVLNFYVQATITTFGAGNVFFRVLPDGSVWVAGALEIEDTARNVARLTATGAVDATVPDITLAYSNPLNLSAFANALGLDDSGRIYLAGRFDSANGNAAPGLVRFTNAGALDTAWAPGAEIRDPLARGTRLVADQGWLHLLGPAAAPSDVRPVGYKRVALTNIAPHIVGQSASRTIYGGQTVQLFAGAFGGSGATYAWTRNGQPVLGAVGPFLNLGPATSDLAGTYRLTVTNNAGSAQTTDIVLTFSGAPLIVSAPQSQSVLEGGSVTLKVQVTSATALTYQWKRYGSDIVGATHDQYVIESATSADAGDYTVVVTNAASSVESSAATLTVNPLPPGPDAPTITQQPLSQTVYNGYNVALGVVVTPPSGATITTYQWYQNNNLYSTFAANGANSSSVTVSAPNTGSSNNYYVVVIASNGGSIKSNTATLTSGTPLSVSTFVGTSTRGTFDGTGFAARFSSPQGAVGDGAGNLYVADSNNHTIRKVTSAGVVTTFAGAAGVNGSTDGSLSVARFSYPRGIALDGAGNLYVISANSIRKISNGNVTTIAGSAFSSGYLDATGTSARFSNPNRLAVDGAGNIYVTDSGNHVVRKITPAGVVTTLAGGGPMAAGFADGVGTAARFNNPFGVTALTDGTLYVTTSNDYTVRRITTDGSVTIVAGTANSGSSIDGIGTAARFDTPQDIFHDGSSALYVSEGVHALRKIDITNGYAVTTVAGAAWQPGSVDGIGTAARFNGPSGIGWMGTGLGIVDRDANIVRHITPQGVVTTLAGVPPGFANGTGSAARFYNVEGIARDVAGNLYVADNGNRVVRKITPAGVVSTFSGSLDSTNYSMVDGPAGSARFMAPRSLTINPATGVLYVLDVGTVRQVQPDGTVSLLAGRTNWETGIAIDGTGIEARFSWASGLAVGPNGDVFVADSGNHVLRKITPAGVVTTIAGVPGSSGTVDGSVSGGVARLDYPVGIAADSTGNIYFGQSNGVLRKLDTSGHVTTIAGRENNYGLVDGFSSFSRFSSIASVAIGPDGNLYVGSWNGTITRVTDAGVVSTLVGFGPGYGDGAGSAARLDIASGITFAPDGTIFVADRNNSVIRRVYASTPITITTQPVGANVLVGASHTFSVTANSPASISYQWTKNGVDISGATGSALPLTNLATADTANYAVRLTAGNTTIFSNTITLTVSTPVPTDNFAGALQLSELSGSTAAISNFAATGEVGEPTHWNANSTGSSLWFSYRPIASGVLTFDTSGSAIDTAMAVYTGSSLANLAFLAQNNDAPNSTASRLTLPVTAGTTYYVAVGSNTSARGNIVLNYTLEVTPQPAISVALGGQNGSLTVFGASIDGVTAQWFKDGSPLAGATSATLAQATAGVFTPGFIVGANPVNTASSLPGVQLNAPADSIVVADFFDDAALGSAWNEQQESSWPEESSELTVARGRLNFGAGNMLSDSAALHQIKRAAALPLDRNWTVVARLGVIGSIIPGTSGTGPVRAAGSQIWITNAADPGDHLVSGFRLINSSGTAFLERFAQITTNYSGFTYLGGSTQSASSVLVRISYDATSGAAAVAYSTGGAFTQASSSNLLGTWGVNRSSFVIVGIGGLATNLNVPTGAAWADDLVTVVEPPSAVTITAQPAGGGFAEGSRNDLVVTVTSISPSPITFQWFKDDVAIGAGTTLFSGNNINNFITVTEAGSYTVAITQNGITTTSNAAVIALSPSAPTFFASGNIANSFAGAGVVVPAGSSAALTVTPAAGSAPLSYQWRFNNADIPGATDPFYFIADWQKANEGLYSVRVTNSLGTATSPAEPFFVTPEGGWCWRNPTPTGNGVTRVAFINGQFVMGGIRGTLLVSNDGLNWTTRQLPAQNNIFKIVTLGDRMLAMGSLNGMFVTKDAVTWETRPIGINGGLTSLQDMVAGNGRVVAFGTGGVTAVSTDGLTWTAGTLGSGNTETLFGATYVLNKYYGVSGDTGKIYSSPDGVSWSGVTTGANSLIGLAYGAGRLVAVGTAGQIVVSSNGTNWTPVTSGTLNDLRGVNFVNNRFVAVGSNGTILTSPDGLVWTPRSAAGNLSILQNTAYGNGRYVIAGQGGRVILTSTDAENWSILTAGPYQGTHLNGIAASGSVLVAVGDAGAVVTSTDGATWTQLNSTTPNQLFDVTFAQNKFVTVGGTGTVLVSDDGASWTWQNQSSALGTSGLQGIRYSSGAGVWIIVGNGGGIYTAPDATPPFTWTKRTVATASQLRRVAVGGGMHVAVGGNGTIASASDPTDTWTIRTSGTTSQFNDVVHGAGTFVAVGANGTISRSTDGVTWSTTQLGALPLLSVTYLNGHFVVTAQSNNYYTSTDGINWTGRTTGAADQLNDTVLFNNQVVGVGRFGTILTADTPIVQGGGAVSVNEGAPATVKFAVSNSPFPVTYSWFKDAQPISGPNSPVLRIAAASSADAGSYTLQATNAFGNTTSSTPVVLSLNVSLSITTHPAPQTALVGGSATFSAIATGVPAPTYQWRLNGIAIPGATSSSVTLNNLRLVDNGTVTVAITNTGGTIVSNGAALTVNPLTPAITSPLTAAAVANAPFRYQIVSSQNATFGATGLPAGLAINTATGVIEGTPTQTGTFNVALTATNVTGSDAETLVLTVQSPAPVITSPPSASGRVGQAFSYTIAATNSPTSYSATGLPAGLALTGATISGTPTAAGFYTVTVGAANATGGATQPVNVQIAASLNAPVFTGGTTVSGTAGGSFTYTPNFGAGNTGFALVDLPDGTPSTLPTGLTLNTSTGTISGTTAQTGTFKVAIRATNADGNTTQVITFTINPAASAPVVTSTGSTVGTVGSAFTFSIATNPAATSFASTALPAGLALNATTGVITGVPSEPGISNVTLTLTNSAGSSTGTLMITINSSALAPVITNAPIATGTAGTAFNFTLTGSNAPTSFTVVNGTLPAGLSLTAATGAITGTPSAPGETHVWIAAANSAGGRGPAVEMLFDIRRALTVPVITSNGTASGQVGQPFQYQVQATNAPTAYTASALPGGLSFSTNTGIISGIPTTETSAPFEVTLTASNGDGSSAPKSLAISIAPAPATPRVTSPLNVGGRAGNAFSYQITATEAPTSFAAGELPAGLSLDSTTGIISGTPTSAGSASVQIRAANTAGLGQASTLLIDIAAPLTAPAITSEATANGKVGTLFTYQITATNTPTSYGLTGTLPAGLAINTTTGIISGNPADNPGLYTVTLTAINSAGTSQPQTLLIGIAPADNAPVVTSPTSATAMVSVPFSYQITATNVPSTTPFPPSVFLDAVNLPPGLAINASTGLIQGTPNVAGTYLVSLVGVNANGTGLPRTLTLTVYPAPTAPVVNSAVSVSARAGTAFTYRITATNDPTSFEALDAPTWLNVNTATGVLSGTPTGPGTLTLRVGASNAGGSSVLVPVSVSIAAAPDTPVITSSQTASGRVGQAFAYDSAATLSPTSYVVSGLPAGLSVDTTNGQIRGTPTVSGKFDVTISGVNANGEGQPVVLVITIATSIQLAGG